MPKTTVFFQMTKIGQDDYDRRGNNKEKGEKRKVRKRREKSKKEGERKRKKEEKLFFLFSSFFLRPSTMHTRKPNEPKKTARKWV